MTIWTIFFEIVRKRADGVVGIDGDLVLLEQAPRPRAHRLSADDSEAVGRLVVEQQILGHRHRLDEVDVLMHGDDALRQRLRRRRRTRTGRPSSSIVPASGACTPAMILASVDLPAPFSPTRPRTRPAAIEKSTPRSARDRRRSCLRQAVCSAAETSASARERALGDRGIVSDGASCSPRSAAG